MVMPLTLRAMLNAPTRGHDFGPDDSTILSSLYHPQIAGRKLADFLQNNIETAAGLNSGYDNPNPLLGPSDESRVNAALTLAGLMQTGSMPFAPKGHGILGAGPVLPDPQKTVDAYKLFKLKRNRPGELFPLFIGKSEAVPQGSFITADFIPTKGFAQRPGWHAGQLPYAPHLMGKDFTMPGDRVWTKVSLPADVDWQKILADRGLKELTNEVPYNGYYRFPRPFNQGGEWLLGGQMRIDDVLSDEAVAEILSKHGLIPPARKGNTYLYDLLMDKRNVERNGVSLRELLDKK